MSDYEEGRNEGWQAALDVQIYGPVSGSTDGLKGGQEYLQGFSDGIELYNSGFDPAGARL